MKTPIGPPTSSSDDRSFSVPRDIGRVMAKGTGWTVGTQLVIQVIAMLSTMILARLLVPADFGLVAVATALAGALHAITEFSFDLALIHNQNATRRDYDAAWTLSICRNAILAGALAAGARLIASSFGDERLEPVVYCLALGTVFAGFQNIAVVDFRKELAFHRDLVFMVVGKLGPALVTVPLAFIWRDYWALVAGIVAGSVFKVALSFAMHRYRPRISFDGWHGLLHFSKWLLIGNLCAFIYGRSSTFVLGKISGASAVGVFTLSGEIAGIATANLLMPLRRAILPGYAKQVLVDDGVTLTELQAILAYLGDKTGRLWPASAAGRAQALQWLFFLSQHVMPAAGEVALRIRSRVTGVPADETVIARGEKALPAGHRQLIRRSREKATWRRKLRSRSWRQRRRFRPRPGMSGSWRLCARRQWCDRAGC